MEKTNRTNKLENIRNRVFNKKGKELDLIDVYHIFMIHYGYFSFTEFISMDSMLKDELLNRIIKIGVKN